jgi:hypothetical protein
MHMPISAWRGCGAFAHKPTAIERRLRDLLAIGAIDADLCRRRYQDDPAAWDCLLDACEAAGRGLRPRR